MAIIIKCDNPARLLKKIKLAIDNDEVETWSYDEDGDFTHTPAQWKYEAWLEPHIHTGELRFGILRRKDIVLTDYIYGVYHGRFIEMLLNHFDEEFIIAYATAHKTVPDNF